MAYSEPRGINIPEYLPSNMDGGIGEAIEQAGQSVKRGAQGLMSYAKSMQRLEDQETEHLTRTGLNDLDVQYFKRSQEDISSVSKETFDEDLESYIRGNPELQKNERASDELRRRAVEQILPSYEKTEIGVRTKRLRESQLEENEKFFNALAQKPLVEYNEAEYAIISSLEYIEDVQAPDEIKEAMKARTLENWMAVASRAPTEKEFNKHISELKTESGDVKLRLPFKWIQQQRERYSKKNGGLSAIAMDQTDGYLEMVKRGEQLTPEQLTLAAQRRVEDPEYGAKFISSQMQSMAGTVFLTVPPEEWERIAEITDEDGRFWAKGYDMASDKSSSGKALAAIYERAFDGATDEEKEIFYKVKGQKAFADEIQLQIDEATKEAARGYPDFMARRSQPVAEAYNKLYSATNEQDRRAARNEIYTMLGRFDKDGKEIPGTSDRNWSFGLERLNEVLNDFQNRSSAEKQEAIDQYLIVNGSNARAFQGIQYMLRNQKAAEITEGEYNGYALTLFSVAAGNAPLNDIFAQDLYDSLDSEWKKRFGETPEQFSRFREQFWNNQRSSEVVNEFVRGLGTMEDFSNHPELQLAVQNMITDVAMYTSINSTPYEGWQKVERYIDRNFASIEIDLDQLDETFVTRKWWFFGKNEPDVRQNMKILFTSNLLNERTMGFFERLKEGVAGSSKKEKVEAWLAQSAMLPLTTDDEEYSIDYASLNIPILDSMFQSELANLPPDKRKELEKTVGKNVEQRNRMLVHRYAVPTFGIDSNGEPVLYYSLKSQDASKSQPLENQDGQRIQFLLNPMLDETIKGRLAYKFEWLFGKTLTTVAPIGEYFFTEKGKEYRESLKPEDLQELQNKFGFGSGAYQFGQSQKEHQQSK